MQCVPRQSMNSRLDNIYDIIYTCLMSYPGITLRDHKRNTWIRNTWKIGVWLTIWNRMMSALLMEQHNAGEQARLTQTRSIRLIKVSTKNMQKGHVDHNSTPAFNMKKRWCIDKWVLSGVFLSTSNTCGAIDTSGKDDFLGVLWNCQLEWQSILWHFTNSTIVFYCVDAFAASFELWYLS